MILAVLLLVYALLFGVFVWAVWKNDPDPGP